MMMDSIQLACFAAGMLALVAAAQHARHWWVGTLALSLLVSAFGLYMLALPFMYIPTPAPDPTVTENALTSWAFASPVAPALVALAYALWYFARGWRRPSTAGADKVTRTERTDRVLTPRWVGSERETMTHWVLGVALGAIAIEIILHVVPVTSFLATSNGQSSIRVIAIIGDLTLNTIQLACFAAGMLALVDAAQHARYWWVGIAICSLLVNAYGFYIQGFIYSQGFIYTSGPSSVPNLTQSVVAHWANNAPVAPALVAFVYALWQLAHGWRGPDVAAAGVVPQS